MNLLFPAEMRNKEHTSDNKSPQLTDTELQQVTGGFGRAMIRKTCFHYGNDQKECEANGCKWEMGKHGYDCVKK